jgi:hypothetical protein
MFLVTSELRDLVTGERVLRPSSTGDEIVTSKGRQS